MDITKNPLVAVPLTVGNDACNFCNKLNERMQIFFKADPHKKQKMIVSKGIYISLFFL